MTPTLSSCVCACVRCVYMCLYICVSTPQFFLTATFNKFIWPQSKMLWTTFFLTHCVTWGIGIWEIPFEGTSGALELTH